MSKYVSGGNIITPYITGLHKPYVYMNRERIAYLITVMVLFGVGGGILIGICAAIMFGMLVGIISGVAIGAVIIGIVLSFMLKS